MPKHVALGIAVRHTKRSKQLITMFSRMGPCSSYDDIEAMDTITAKKVQERRLKWYGHVMRREEHYVGRRAMVMKVQGRRKIGRPKRRWLDKVKDDIKEKGLSADDVYDRATWRRMSSYIDPT